MKRKWCKHYLFLGTVIMLIVSVMCSFLLLDKSLQQKKDKHDFESIYVDTTIDFIVPSPSYEQVLELENNRELGIGAFTPYYSTSTRVITSDSFDGDVLMFPDVSKINNTPYSAARIISGDTEYSEGSAIIDQTFQENNKVNIGDEITISIVDQEMSFDIVAVVEDNTYCDGSIALILSETQGALLQDNGIIYSAAYVEAEDMSTCESYLNNEYIPLGRLGSPEDYNSQEAYDAHVESFYAADWSKEVTNCSDNFSKLSARYSNVESIINRNTVIHALIVAIVLLVYGLILLFNPTLKKFIQGYLVKKGGTIKNIMSFYVSGLIYLAALGTLVSLGLYVYSTSNLKMSIWENISIVLIPVGSVVAVCVILILFSLVVVSAMYSRKRIQRLSSEQK